MFLKKISAEFVSTKLVPEIKYIGKKIFQGAKKILSKNKLERSPKADCFDAKPIIEEIKLPTPEQIQKQPIRKYRTEIKTPSGVGGIYNETLIDEYGEKTILSQAKRDKKGNIFIRKDFESIDGTKTHQRFYHSASGNRFSRYRIIDKDGNIIFNDSKSFKVVDKNTAFSTNNGYSWIIKSDEKSINLRSFETGKKFKIDLKEMVPDEDPEVINLLKKLSAEDLIMAQKQKIKISLSDYSSVNGKREFKTDNSLSSFQHEQGHVYDTDFDNWCGTGLITGKRRFLDTYMKERENFLGRFGDTGKEDLAYFIDENYHIKERKYTNPFVSCVGETAAESKMLIDFYQDEPRLTTRSHLLQRYFPKTIAQVGNFLHQMDLRNILLP